MGVLAPSAAQGFGFTSAPTAAGNSLNWGAAGTGLDATGQLLQGVGGFQQAAYAAQVAVNNAKIARANAGAAIGAGNYEGAVSKLRTGETISAERVGQAASGVDVNIGSAKLVRESTATLGAMDAAMIHYNAARQAYGENVQASADEAQSKLDRMAGAGALEGSLFKVGSTLLGGASSIGSKYAQYQQTGALGG